MLSIRDILEKSTTKWLENKLFWMNAARKTHKYTIFEHETFKQVKFKISDIKNLKSSSKSKYK